MLFDNESGAMTTDTEMSTEARSCIVGAAMYESLATDEINDFVSDPSATTTAVTEGVLMERTIVKLDKQARLQSYYKAAIFTIAKEKNDRDFKKLLTIWKTERALEAKLEKKYKNEAMKRAKQAMRDAKKSRVPIVSKVADAVTNK